ncbi:hypothetical protein L3Q65_46180 [Amycolatopsis sp. FU40]|uniref:hypothetical protein n=1 Tax=Amycolatopsis sp. FU40 TaxID=2914159 RepID=UPI001F1E3D7D|nr:hypothetical protein [Amycolatopsis sp. FU40]UKD55164.1 hypothetical protein L3Q65_46180 [Amycolatopsis sp. FU40]
MLFAADEVDPSAGPPWLAILLGVLTLIGVLVTAYSPVLVERIKQRRAKEPATPDSAATLPAAPAAVRRTDQALDLVSDAMADARRERDEAQDDNRRLLKANAKLVQENAALKGLVYRLDPMWNGEIRGRSPH